ncbi:U-box domain-containing protein 35-like isoform X2 [Asparagus officinalis]|uniref:U-box domain-containing protein 35-like isoform X2 n=1 Tax=Asparagus officinalis TaxID=4686 RepID=UPI00098E132B|nr:U-box domain-containing protein 35-like isoform X2 [Asparagus officinalis]
MEIEEMKERGESLSNLTVAVAVNGTKNSKYALKWALEKFIPEGRIFFRLIYVQPKITMVPTPMGNYIPISKVRDDIASAYRKDVETQTTSMLQPYKKMCNQRKVEAEAVVIEADDVAEAISAEIDKFTVSKLVIGVSSRNIFSRKLKGSKMSSRISGCIPNFCTLYVVSKGVLSFVHAPSSCEIHNKGLESTSSIVSCNSLSCSSSGKSEGMNSEISSNFSLTQSPSLSSQRNQALKVINQNFGDVIARFGDNLHVRTPSVSTDDNLMSSSSNTSEMEHINSTQTDTCSWNSGQASTSDIAKNPSFLQSDMYEVAQDESTDASHELKELKAQHEEKAVRLNEIKLREEKVREMARVERERREAAEREAQYVRECVKKESLQRKDAEDSAARESADKKRLERAEQYKKYTWEEIEAATLLFSDDLKIGSGANGTVYKANFHHTIAAVKILTSDEVRGMKQFKQELEILGRIRHPHLLLLIGACPDHGCLVYEYMENGSLEDRLQCKNNTSPLPWYYRYRIAWEIASALVFLHSSKPDPIVHRDLKPANILLDKNFVSKIGDVGLSTILPDLNFSKSTMYKDTAPVGTFFYIDPEYQRTGQVSPKSDTYALGVIILQLITGKSPMGLAYRVEMALEVDSLVDVLDSGAGKWPIEETRELAVLGLNCVELRRKDRPELKDSVLPILERLKDFADKVQNSVGHMSPGIPGHFICPILQEVMEDPCVASDGYTYERRAIERWCRMNDKSPLTNMKLPNTNLITNQSLLSAIKDWKARTQ